MKTEALPILVIVLIFGCSKSERSCLEDYFNILQDSVPGEGIITSIRFCKEDSLVFMIPLIRGAVRAISNDEVYKDLNNCVSSCLDHIPITDRDRVLVLAFRKYLNSETVDINQTYVDVAEIHARFHSDVKAREIAQRLDLQEIVLNNANMTEVGDTLELVFQLETTNGYSTIIYSSYAAAQDHTMTDDTLVMHGVLQERYYEDKETGNRKPFSGDIMDLTYKVRVIQLIPDSVYDFARKIEVGDDFIVRLETYNRLIK